MIIAFSQGPKIRVELNFEDLLFKSSSLSISNRFECSIEGEADAKIKENLLNFLESYEEKRFLKVELNLDFLMPFRKKALRCLQSVPFGEVLSYGELAAKIGHPQAARAIGTACHFNPYPLFIPCHRIIASGRLLGGFAQDLKIKKLLLDFEGVRTKG